MLAGSSLVPASAALAVFMVCMAVFFFMTNKKSVRGRMQRMVTQNDDAQKREEPPSESLEPNQEITGIAVLLDRILRTLAIDVETFSKNNQLLFYRAGAMSANAPVYYLFMRRIGAVLFLLLAVKFATMHAEGSQKAAHYLSAVILFVLGIFGPGIYLKNARSKRELILKRSFPDALDLLLVCVDSGLALDGALARVCKELKSTAPVIAQELNRTRLELTLLNDRTQALNNLAERTDMAPFRALVASLLQSERFGTSLSETLRVLSEDYRHARLMLAEEKAGRLPTLMTIPLITLMLPALFLIILGPILIKMLGMGIVDGSGH